MENSDLNKVLSLTEMQNILPDYVFGRASEVEKLLFEKSLVLYPELQKEISDVNEVFRKLESFDFNKVIDQKTKNLSVKVNNRLQAKYSKNSGMFFFRYLAPVLGVVVILFFVYKTNMPVNKQLNSSSVEFSSAKNPAPEQPKALAQNTPINKPSVNDIKIQPERAEQKSDKSIKTDALYDFKPEMAYLSQINMTNDDFENMTVSDINDYLLDQIINEPNGLNVLQTNGLNESEQDLMKQLNNIDEKEINNIIEELQNANV